MAFLIFRGGCIVACGVALKAAGAVPPVKLKEGRVLGSKQTEELGVLKFKPVDDVEEDAIPPKLNPPEAVEVVALDPKLNPVFGAGVEENDGVDWF